jgi:hypothetical protein
VLVQYGLFSGRKIAITYHALSARPPLKKLVQICLLVARPTLSERGPSGWQVPRNRYALMTHSYHCNAQADRRFDVHRRILTALPNPGDFVAAITGDPLLAIAEGTDLSTVDAPRFQWNGDTSIMIANMSLGNWLGYHPASEWRVPSKGPGLQTAIGTRCAHFAGDDRGSVDWKPREL